MEDRRKTWVLLTEDGHNYLELKKKEFEENIIRLFEKLDDKEIEKFSDSLRNIVEILKKV